MVKSFAILPVVNEGTFKFNVPSLIITGIGSLLVDEFLLYKIQATGQLSTNTSLSDYSFLISHNKHK